MNVNTMSNAHLPESEGRKEYTPKIGLIYHKESTELILCKPKLMPLKSVTLEKLEKVQRTSDAALRFHQPMKK